VGSLDFHLALAVASAFFLARVMLKEVQWRIGTFTTVCHDGSLKTRQGGQLQLSITQYRGVPLPQISREAELGT
jgi:hypothetical protein